MKSRLRRCTAYAPLTASKSHPTQLSGSRQPRAFLLYTTANTSPRSPTKHNFAPRNGRCVPPDTFELVKVAVDSEGPSA